MVLITIYYYIIMFKSIIIALLLIKISLFNVSYVENIIIFLLPILYYYLLLTI